MDTIARRPLARPLPRQPTCLDKIYIANPCKVAWDDMEGADDRVRRCLTCKSNVYNISGMTRYSAEKLLTSTEGRLCGRIYRRFDGTVLTADCPRGATDSAYFAWFKFTAVLIGILGFFGVGVLTFFGPNLRALFASAGGMMGGATSRRLETPTTQVRRITVPQSAYETDGPRKRE